MFAVVVKNVVARRGLALPSRSLVPVRTHVVSGPPTEKVSHAERIALGLFMTVGILIIPSYLMTQLKTYKKVEAE